jgi:hypothetical protein
MHKKLVDYLKNVSGESKHIIAVSIDIRDFSRFCKRNDSADVAIFISKFYLNLIERFQTIVKNFFFKPTGDGLMICIPYLESNLPERFQQLIEVAIKCHDEFKDMFNNVEIINFETPKNLGIGIARGSASEILSNDEGNEIVIDYSGHKLNFAARLQDLARPSGIIFENSRDLNFLSAKTKTLFSVIDIYVRSVAEDKPASICYLKENVKIQKENLEPLTSHWLTVSRTFTKTKLIKTTVNLHIDLDNDKKQINSFRVRLQRPAIEWKDGFTGIIWQTLRESGDYTYVTYGGKPAIILKIKQINQTYSEFINTARQKDNLEFIVEYKVD